MNVNDTFFAVCRCDDKKSRILTDKVDVLLAGEPDAGVELPQNKLILAGLPDILNQPAVVDVRAVVSNAVRLFDGHRSGTEGLDNFPVPLAPVAGGQRGYGEHQREEVQGERERGSPPPVHPHDDEHGSRLMFISGGLSCVGVQCFFSHCSHRVLHAELLRASFLM